MIVSRRIFSDMSRPFLLAFLVSALAVTTTHAQITVHTSSLSAEARAHLVVADTTIRTQIVPGGRIDVDDVVFRAAYRLHVDITPLATPEMTARAYLRAASRAFGWSPDADNLALESVSGTPDSRHVVFRQMFHGLPVEGRRVKVNMDREGRPSMVFSAYAPGMDPAAPFNAQASIGASSAAHLAKEALMPTGGQTNTPELVVMPGAVPRLAWRMLAWPEDGISEWKVIIDAHTGEIINLIDQRVREHRGKEAPALFPDTGAGPVITALPHSSVRRVTGTGYVFDPDPISTSGQTYVPPYVDANDADNSALDAERVLVDLTDISQGSDGLYRLEGPFARIDGPLVTDGASVPPPAEASPDGFRYNRSQTGFEAVMAYFHIDTSQRHVQTLGFFDRQNGSLPINPRKNNEDNSFFLPGANRIEMGTGGVDDAEDAFVIWHEYGHALLEAGAPDLLSTSEGQALHEGWADYWAASYTRSLIEQGLSKRQDWQQLFKWDAGDGSPDLWGGRQLGNPGHYPEDVPCSRNSLLCDIWSEGDLFATTLMEIYDALGRTITDQLNLYSHAYLLAPVTMGDAAEAIIQADQDHFGGEHVGVLLDSFGARGFVDASKFGPQIFHQPLVATEQLGGTVHIEVTVSSASTSIDSVRVVYGATQPPVDRLLLRPGTGDVFAGELPLPTTPGTLYYYIEAVDDLGRTNRLPATTSFNLAFGPDLEAPTVVHTPFTSRSLASWPADLTASVTDNLGVDSVWASFSIDAQDGSQTTAGAFGLNLEETSYRGTFPVPVSALELGSRVHYQIHARDVASAANEAILPSTGSFSFVITASGVLQEFDFETLGPNLSATGVWARGEPDFGLEVAHSGRFVWATVPGGPYPDTGGLSSLELPALNLNGQSEAFLVFWHWYDLEHNGLVEPGRIHAGQVLWDGANIKSSTDGGVSWTVLQPEGGYSGTVFDTPENPIGKEPAFGGYSFGWRREIVPLPIAPDVRIRFDFGTDNDNADVAVSFAGWAIDDVAVTTVHPTDTEAPALISPTPSFIIQAAGTPPAPFSIEATDNTGVADALVAYTLTTSTGDATDTLRLAMRPTDRNTFEGAIVPGTKLAPGDIVSYRLLLRDFADNETLVPAANIAPARIEYRLIKQASALNGVRASGIWHPSGPAWVTSSGTPAPERSTLVLAPLDLPENAAGMTLSLNHRYVLAGGTGGNVKVSVDDGQSWAVLSPEAGYDATFASGNAHPMNGETVFGGTTTGFVTTTFNLAKFAGKQVRLRIDFGTSRVLGSNEFWEISQATFAQSTTDEAFDTPRKLRLLANFPDPFSTSTTISYSLPETMPIKLAIFDVLGRLVTRLTDTVQSPGTYTVTFDGSRLAGGVYFLRLLAGGTQKMERMVVAH